MRSNNLNKDIPFGKRVTIYPGALNDPSVEPISTLMLKDDFTFPIGAEYNKMSGTSASFGRSLGSSIISELFGGSLAGDLAAGVVGGLNNRLGFQTYASAKPITATLNCSLMAISDAWEDVVNPVRTIQNLVLPTAITGGFLTDFPGVDPLVALTGGSLSLSKSYKDASITVGRIGFNHVIFNDVNVTFSGEVDTKGYPIYADITIDFETSYFATTNMLNEEVYGCSEKGVVISNPDEVTVESLEEFVEDLKESTREWWGA